jgi:prepilin-type processing-associated H-X9-DG protein
MFTEAMWSAIQAPVAPTWSYADRLAWRHGTTKPRVIRIDVGVPITVIGSRVSAVFLDGHAEGIDEDFSYNIVQFQPDGQ